MSEYDERNDESSSSDSSDDECDYEREYYDNECPKCIADGNYEFVPINPSTITDVPKLLDMAAVAVAGALWNHVNVAKAVSGVHSRCTKSSTEWTTVRGKVIALIKQLPASEEFTKHIDRYVRKMAKEITTWVSYIYQTVFLENGIDKFVYSLVFRIVWNPDGTINCVKTAKNMKTSLKLSEVEKFRFFATYCLKEEMSELSHGCSKYALNYVKFFGNPLIFYWACHFQDELQKIRATKGFIKNLSVDVNMLQNRQVDNWSAKEYFFDRLSSEEQVQQAIWLIDKHGAVYQKEVLLKLDETQRLHVYMERATQIIVNFARPSINSRFLLQTWSEVRNLISPDQFFDLFRDLLMKTEVKDVILTKIWSSASDDLKQRVVCAEEYEIVKKILTEWKWRDDSDFVFVLVQDSNASVKKAISTKPFFNIYCERLIVNDKFQKLDKLLNFFLCDVEDLKQFKTNLANNSEHVRKTCLKFHSSKDTKGLNAYLKQLLAPFPGIVAQCKKNLISSFK
ncbi:uncharacterized protein LOC135848976 [Planococcus citri]|uniref:uncharacterized protein LOC135848976 n=1 Tax=Planococcus citri TaxID=170843 RepID=UPI0031F79CB9